MTRHATAVAFRTPLDAELCASLVGSLVKFLLYMRGQIPCAFDELERLVAAYRGIQQQDGRVSGGRPGGSMRKAVKCVDAVDQLVRDGLPAVFAGRVQTVAIVLGASLLSPREAVVVDFGAVERPDIGSIALPHVSSESIPKDKLARLCAQKLLRGLVVDGALQYTAGLAVQRVHVAVLAEKQHGRLVPGFQPKQNFSLRLPKTKRLQDERTHRIRLSTGAGSGDAGLSEEQSSDTSLPASWDDSLIWYVLEQPIHGFTGAL